MFRVRFWEVLRRVRPDRGDYLLAGPVLGGFRDRLFELRGGLLFTRFSELLLDVHVWCLFRGGGLCLHFLPCGPVQLCFQYGDVDHSDTWCILWRGWWFRL